MSTNQNVTDIVKYTAKFQSNRFCGDGVTANWVFIWNKIACIAYKEHVTDICLKHSRHHDTTVHAREHDSFRLYSIIIIIYFTAA